MCNWRMRQAVKKEVGSAQRKFVAKGMTDKLTNWLTDKLAQLALAQWDTQCKPICQVWVYFMAMALTIRNSKPTLAAVNTHTHTHKRTRTLTDNYSFFY